MGSNKEGLLCRLFSIFFIPVIIAISSSAIYAPVIDTNDQYIETMELEPEESVEQESDIYSIDNLQYFIDKAKEEEALKEIEDEEVPMTELPEDLFPIEIDPTDIAVQKAIQAFSNDVLEIGYERMCWNFDNVPLNEDLMNVIIEKCDEIGIPIPVILGLIETESSFDPYARGGKGGYHYGLMQLSEKWFPKGLSPADNIRTGMDYLYEKYQETGDIYLALDAYHAGHVTGNMDYSDLIMERAQTWSEITNVSITFS